ncbi:NAD-dependent succinate-semialdehyde dehydrogenase [Pseudoxanthobacter sp.]|uniref:NAD-dependent succinate-semialdehyde dehydrogenase n=1 Tax=Pseudoxanthobacter sp. TaxID=1925742 RepID=UPI002FDF1211
MSAPSPAVSSATPPASRLAGGLADRLADPGLFIERAFIGGAWVGAENGATLSVDDPATGAAIGTVPACGTAETEAAIAAAEAAWPAWRARPAAERADLLERWYALMMENAADLARLMTAEQGKPLAEAMGEITYGAGFIRWFAGEARRIDGLLLPAPTADRRILVQKEPVGVCAIITPWNFPNAMITRKVAPALAAGCTVVIKPSELTPYSALALVALAERAGIPHGVINIVTGLAPAIGAALTASPVVRKLSFTGSTAVGALLMRESAATIKRLSLELGGNAPFIVFDDADLDAAIAGVMASKFRNAGQTCVCANRIFVQAGIHDRFVERLAAAVRGLTIGNGFTPGVAIGPLISPAAVQKVGGHIADALALGAENVTGRNDDVDPQRFVSPVVLTGATAAMRVAREETFGPVAPVFRFDDEDEAVAAANDTPFGLAAYYYTGSLSRGFRVGEKLAFGMVGLNTGSVSLEVAPFGGIKQSGLGREGGPTGIDEYLALKTMHVGLTA